MAFHPGIAYGIAITTALVLMCMGAKNRRSGWRKERTNGVLDVFMAWAQAHQQLRHASPYPAAPRLGPAELGDQLAALTTALNVNAGTSMPTQPSVSASAAPVRETSKIAAERR